MAPPSELLLLYFKDIHYRDLNDNFNRKRGQQKIDTLCNLQHPGQCTGDSLIKKTTVDICMNYNLIKT